MIIENKTTENGDVLRISTDVPVLGLVLLYGFLDNTSGESPDMYFQKKFRYSKDIGINWSDWQLLTAANIQNVPIRNKESFLFEYAYQHEGRNGELYFNWVQLEGEVNQGDDTIYSKTDFKQFFDVNDINVLGWAFNVLEKLYQQGILPKYVQRDYTENSKDFIDYWLSVTHFFALIVYMARQFQDIPGNNILFNLFIEGRGLALSGSETQLQRNYLFAHYIDEYRKRGTANIIDQDGTVYGEFLRLINYDPKEEFMFFNLVRQNLGWCCDFSSPMWIGTEQILNATKAYEYSDSVKDLSKYPTVGSVDIFQYGDYDWLRLGTTVGTNGIDVSNGNLLLEDKQPLLLEEGGEIRLERSDLVLKEQLQKISPSIPYEIYFRIIAISNDDTAPDHLNFGVKGYNENLQPVDFLNAQTGEPQNSFFSEVPARVIYKVNTEYWFRAVIWRADEVPGASMNLNFLNGVPLISSKDMRYFSPVITQAYVAGDKSLLIRDIKIKPLQLSVEQGYLGSILPIATYFYNNSGREDSYIKNFTEQYLLSYKNNVLLPTYLTEVEVIFFVLTIAWQPTDGGVVVGAGTYRQGDIATIRITPSVGYQIDSVVIDGEAKVPANQYLVSMTKNIQANVVFKKTLANFVTQKRAFSFEGTQYDGNLVIDWGDGITTTNTLTHRYTDSLQQHIITVNEGDITTLNVPDNEILSANFVNMPNIDVLNMDNNLLTQLDISSLTNVTSVSLSGNQLANISLTANPEINYLDLAQNNFSSIDLSTLAKLKNLILKDNQLTSLDLSLNTALINLDADNNVMTSLNLGQGTSLKTVTVYNNKLTSFSLPASNILTSLNIGKNNLPSASFTSATYSKLETLLISDMPVLKTLSVTSIATLTELTAKNNAQATTYTITGNVKLPALDISGCTVLYTATCNGNTLLSSVNVNNDSTLYTLNLDNCALTTISLNTNIALNTLSINNNKLTTFSAPYCTALASLSLDNNQLGSITLNNNTKLVVLSVSNNKLTTLGIFSPILRTLDCDHNLLTSTSTTNWQNITTLESVDGRNNNFTSFMFDNNPSIKTIKLDDCVNLTTVRITYNPQLANLTLSGNVALTNLVGYNNALTSVTVDGDIYLSEVSLGNNQISSFSYVGCKRIKTLLLDSNLLTSIDADYLGETLETLSINKNRLTELTLTKTTELKYVSCNNNLMTSLTIEPDEAPEQTTVESIVDDLSIQPYIAYLFNGNTNKMNRSLLSLDSFTGVSYTSGYEPGRQALQCNTTYCQMPLTMSSNSTDRVCASVMIYPTDNDPSVYNGIFGGLMFGLKTGKFGWALGWGGNNFENKLNLDLYTTAGRLALQGPVLEPNEWHHIMFNINYTGAAGSSWSMTLYVDGVRYTNSGNPGGDHLDFDGLESSTGTRNLFIGRAYQLGWKYFRGKMQDPIIGYSNFSENDFDILNNYYKSAGTVVRFENLTTLDCSNNQLTTLDLTHADCLTDLDCSYNLLGKDTPVTEQAITFGTAFVQNPLTRLIASNNQLKMIVLSNNENLVTVDVSDNPDLSDLLTNISIGAMGKAKTLLAYNTAIPGFSHFIWPALVKLDLHNTPVNQYLPSGTTGLIEYLDISETRFPSLAITTMLGQNAAKLREVYLKNLTHFPDDFELEVYNMPNLKRLDISGSNIPRINFEKGTTFTLSVEWLSVENCQQLSVLPTYTLVNATYLNFANSNISSIIPTSEPQKFEEIHSEHSYLASNFSTNYNSFLGNLNSTTTGKYYYSSDDIYIKDTASGGWGFGDLLKAAGWTLILVD